MHDLLAAALREKIQSGGLKPRAQLPSEEALRQEYDVSRTTVRRAPAELRHEGLVEIRRPFGTFVIGPAAIWYSGRGIQRPARAR